MSTSSADPLATFRFFRHHRLVRRSVAVLFVLLVLCLIAALAARLWMRHALHDSLPKVDGTLHIEGLSAPVKVIRDEHGVPHIVAQNMDDLVLAQAYITAQDRLWQMDLLRRHGAGELAEILGKQLIEHDKLQRYLRLRATADRAVASLDPAEHHWLDIYTNGVNAAIAAQMDHLPIEFRLLGYKPKPWTARDSLLIGFVMAQDLSTAFPEKLDREAIMAKLSPELQADIFPVGSWRDHPPMSGKPDMSAPNGYVEVPLDESQASLQNPERLKAMESIEKTLAPWVSTYACDGCTAGSNNWVVNGQHTASGHPMLANDMHLTLGAPGIWYEADLESGSFHVSGVTLPGTPFVIVGHNQHIAWGFTNSGADVQDIYIENVNSDRYRDASGAWQPLEHAAEHIVVQGGSDIDLDVVSTRHGSSVTPLLTPLYEKETRAIALRWSIYDTSIAGDPFGKVNAAANWNEFLDAFRNFGGPSQNAVYADDAGHIGYHMIGKVPVRGESGLTPVPVPSGTYEWTGYINFDDMPQVYDPPAGIIATANARTSADDSKVKITLDWENPYRNERIWKVLSDAKSLTPADYLKLQMDTHSELDLTIAQRVAYAVDHTPNASKRAKAAADILRNWDGNASATSAPESIAAAVRIALWPMLLEPKVGDETAKRYHWRSRLFALEDLLTKMSARWLPPGVKDWNDLLNQALEKGLDERHAPSDISRWKWGDQNPLDMQHPIFSKSLPLRAVLGLTIGAPRLPRDGNTTTVKQLTGAIGPSERFTSDPNDPEHAHMNLPMGQSGNVTSPWFGDQFPAWYNGTTFTLPFSNSGDNAHTLTLTPQ